MKTSLVRNNVFRESGWETCGENKTKITGEAVIKRTYQKFIGVDHPALVGFGVVTRLYGDTVSQALWHHTEGLLSDQPQPGVVKVLVLNRGEKTLIESQPQAHNCIDTSILVVPMLRIRK